MPYLPTAQEWLTQSTLLLQARPTSTRITSKYTISPPSTKIPPLTTTTTTTSKPPTDASPPNPAARATLTLKTYDPQSGTTLKYTTDKGAEVSWLIQILGRLARGMAGLEEGGEVVEEGKEEDVVMKEVVKSSAQQALPQQQQQQQQGGKGKGKKKGKK